MADKVRIASVGLGWWGGSLARAAAETGVLEVVSCFARTPETRRRFAEEHGCRQAGSLDDLMADPEVEAILVATSNSTHRPIVEAAAAAGKHVFVEKPLTLSVADGRAAVDAAEAGGIVLQVGHQRRRHPANRAARRLIEAGELGDIQLMESHHSVPNGFKLPEKAWRRQPEESPLGSMTSLGIHTIDTYHYLGGRIGAVSAITRSGRGDLTIDEATGLLFEFESGAIGTLVSSFFSPQLVRLSVHGTDGSVFSEADGSTLYFQSRDEPTPSERLVDPVDPVVDQLADFAAAIRSETPPEVGGEEGLEVVAVLQAAVESAETGRRVDVADHRR